MVPRFDNTLARRFKKITFLIICSAFASLSIISGQNTREQKPPLRERMFFGGSLGLQFGTYTNINVTPIVGLWVRPRIAIAAGPNFTYYKDPYYATTMYGGNAYVQFVPVKDINNALPIGIHMGIFLHLEDELNRTVIEMKGISDHLNIDIWIHEPEACNARLPVMKPPHGIKDVGNARCSCMKCPFRLLKCGIGVPKAYRYPYIGHAFNKP